MFLRLFALALPIILLVDFVWLSISLDRFYKPQIGHLIRSDVNYIAAIILYALLAAGLVFFTILPGIEGSKSLTKIILSGAFMGLLTYGVYDLTNLATLKGWTLQITVIDMLWGATLCAIVSGITVTAFHFFFKA